MTGSTGSTPTPFGFAGGWGYQSDETGLQLLGLRYYDPSTGRFLTRDPISDGRNWYTYCDNNPTKYADDSGLKKVVIIVGAGLNDGEHKDGPFLRNTLNLAEKWKQFFLDMGYSEDEIVILHAPTNKQVEKELEDADGFVFIGHGNKDYGRLRGDGGKSGKGHTTSWIDVKFIRKVIRKRRHGKKFQFIVLESCNMGKNKDWADLADLVYGYTGHANIDKRYHQWEVTHGYGPTRMLPIHHRLRGVSR